MVLMSIPKFERFFRSAAGLDVDKEDLRRLDEFINRKIYDLLLRAQANASANDRDVIFAADLPITKGMQESMHGFREINEDIDLQPILEQLTKFPVLDLDYGDDVSGQLPEIAGAISFALARSFKIMNPDLKNPMPDDWDRAFRMFDQLL